MTASVQGMLRSRRPPMRTISQTLKAFLLEQGYRELRLVDGKVCGLHAYNFTTGLVVGLTFEGYERRYCYEHQRDAQLALAAWCGQAHPDGLWIKCKGAGIDLLNPRWSKSQLQAGRTMASAAGTASGLRR